MMPPGYITCKISLTETSQFRRLVAFVSEVEVHARAEDDYALLALVDAMREDLLKGDGE